jgi:type I restriction enzyme M protein
MNGFQDKLNFIWSVADEVLRDDFKRGKYPDVILPFTVLRRLDCVLAPSKEKVLKRHEDLKSKGLTNLDGQLRKAAGYSFYNTSLFDFNKLLDDPKNIAKNLRAYINSFSENMREVVDKFKLRATIDTLDEKGLLFMLIKKFGEVDLHPEAVTNHDMGYIFEELIRKFNEQSNENPGEHFTPREVIRLMVRLVLNGDKEILKQQSVLRTVYDPACGSGGMLSISKEYVRDKFNPDADIRLFGQEVNDETYAVCKSDMLIKGDDRDADNIKPDSCLTKDGHQHTTFDYMLSNPPYGKDWKKEKDEIEAEAERGHAGRFGAGLPRINDGQMLFLQHMLSKRKDEEEGGSRIAIVLNGSPLFTGDAGSGESEIRRWILENDWLETIVALPGQLFYNTGINTYIWVLSNRKPKKRRGKVLLINGAATKKEGDKEEEIFARKMRKSLGDKRNELGEDHIIELAQMAAAFEEGKYTNIFDTTDFAYRKITVERPLRLNFQASPERIGRIKEQTAFQNLAKSKKKGKAADEEIKEGATMQKAVFSTVEKLDSAIICKNREEFSALLDEVFGKAEIKLTAPLKKAVLSALGERDEAADICRDTDSNPEPDPELRDYENVPFKEDIYAYFDREVSPHVPDAWINENVRDEKDGKVGRVGYEINFTRYFYVYEPPRPLDQIDADIKALEADILSMLREVTK